MQSHALEAPAPSRAIQPLPGLLRELALGWSAELQLAANAYVVDHALECAPLLRVDVVLMLLRIGSEEALRRVQELTGKPITHCPAAVPPWPPKPVAKRPRVPTVQRLVENPCLPATDMHRRYGLVRIGMTKVQLLARGVTMRDLRVWQKSDYLSFAKQ